MRRNRPKWRSRAVEKDDNLERAEGTGGGRVEEERSVVRRERII